MRTNQRFFSFREVLLDPDFISLCSQPVDKKTCNTSFLTEKDYPKTELFSIIVIQHVVLLFIFNVSKTHVSI